MKDVEEEMLDFEYEFKEFRNFEVATQSPNFNLNWNSNSNLYFNNSVLQDWEHRRRKCVVQLVCYLIHNIYLLEEISTIVDRPLSYGNAEREGMRRIFMKQLEEIEKCRDVIRMGPQAFMQLCVKLRNTGKVRDSRNVTVEEQVAKFLHTLAHNVRSRTMAFYFNRSRETISHHFHNVLQAIISLEAEFIIQPSGSEVPPEILNNERFYLYFKDCIGAIDGTHVRAKVSKEEVARFRGCKDYPTQNVFAACSFDMKFTYVLAGWEGTASDSRILKNALSREDKIIIPQGKFYLGDAGFPLKRGLITPYRGVRYHLKEYSTRTPQNAREIFNHRHASLRNVIERTFGVLKKRFPIIGSGTEPHFSIETMVDIVIACCILHNFLMGVDPDEALISEVDRELSRNPSIDDEFAHNQEEDYRQGSILRDHIAAHMWHVYSTNM